MGCTAAESAAFTDAIAGWFIVDSLLIGFRFLFVYDICSLICHMIWPRHPSQPTPAVSLIHFACAACLFSRAQLPPKRNKYICAKIVTGLYPVLVDSLHCWRCLSLSLAPARHPLPAAVFAAQIFATHSVAVRRLLRWHVLRMPVHLSKTLAMLAKCNFHRCWHCRCANAFALR